MGSALTAILAPNASLFTGDGTKTYIVGGAEGVTVVDPGSEDEAHLGRVAVAAAQTGPPTGVVMTHHHADHAEGAVTLAARLGVPLVAFPHPEAPPLDRDLADGDVVGAGDGALTVVHTPGHASDHLCLFLRSANVVLVGDLVAGTGFIVIDPPDGDMAEYLASLARVRDLGANKLMPAHGPTIDDPRAYLDGYIAHRLEREARILAAVAPGDAVTLAAILPVAYSDTPEAMHPVAARSLLAHLDKLVADGALERSGRGEAATYRQA